MGITSFLNSLLSSNTKTKTRRHFKQNKTRHHKFKHKHTYRHHKSRGNKRYQRGG